MSDWKKSSEKEKKMNFIYNCISISTNGYRVFECTEFKRLFSQISTSLEYMFYFGGGRIQNFDAVSCLIVFLSLLIFRTYINGFNPQHWFLLNRERTVRSTTILSNEHVVLGHLLLCLKKDSLQYEASHIHIWFKVGTHPKGL